ncbi:uracil DNA glycosylase [Coemansia sp. IMI 209127]|nr:uracil DNA glycosylase [Coemansia sp. IMI 209127]
MPKVATEKNIAAPAPASSSSSSSSLGKQRKTIDAYFGSAKRPQNGAKPSRLATKGKQKAVEAEVEAKAESGAVVATRPPVQPADRPELKLEYETIDASWLVHLEPEFSKPYFVQLKKFLREQEAQGKTIFPAPRDVYSWSRYAPLDKVRVVILGQDPYHGPGQAHGLAFSVRPQVRTPPSLLNMYKALALDYPGEFTKPSHGFLRGWAEQGVLLLNASLTVECHKANAHAGHGWEQFTDRVVALVNERNEHVVFMLWGAYAQKKGATLDKTRHCVLTTVHPSPLSASRGFFEAAHFRRANEYLEAHGRDPIDWTHLPVEEKNSTA